MCFRKLIIKAKERLKGRDIIDMGMGNPDSSTPKHIVNKLISTIKILKPTDIQSQEV